LSQHLYICGPPWWSRLGGFHARGPCARHVADATSGGGRSRTLPSPPSRSMGAGSVEAAGVNVGEGEAAAGGGVAAAGGTPGMRGGAARAQLELLLLCSVKATSAGETVIRGSRNPATEPCAAAVAAPQATKNNAADLIPRRITGLRGGRRRRSTTT
jgi:hypothetical protein